MLRFEPEYVKTLWGGRRLAERFSRDIPQGTIGGSWGLVDLDQHCSRVAEGVRRGPALGELWRSGALGVVAAAKLGDGEIEVLSKGCTLIGEASPNDSAESPLHTRFA